MTLRRILFVPDTHAPAHHPPSWNCMLRAAKVFRPNEVVVLGDFVDADTISAHARTKAATHSRLIDEVRPVRALLHQLETLGAQKLQYIMGNHEYRLERYLAKEAPALDELVNWDTLLKLTENGWGITPYKKTYQLGKLNLTHDVGQAGANAHRGAGQAFMGSTVIGHTHRMAYEVRGRIGRRPYVTAMFGWLGEPDAIDYVHEARAREWVHGFGIGWHDTSTGMVHLQPVPIVDGKACVLGRLV